MAYSAQQKFDNSLEKFSDRLFDPSYLIISSEERCEKLRAGGYGRKIDMDVINSHSNYFRDWMNLQADWFRLKQKTIPAFMIGVANGGNRIALQQASLISPNEIQVIQTWKNEAENPPSPRILPLASYVISSTVYHVPSARFCIIDDVGSSGGAAAEVADQLLEFGVGKQNIEVVYSVQRSEDLPALDEREIAYDAMIKHTLPIYDSYEECVGGVPLGRTPVNSPVS